MSDRYQIQGKIGQGGLGAVYKAFDTHLRREVAIKRVLTPDEASKDDVNEAAEKLMQEATVLSTLNHPNIVSIFDVGRDESGGFVVMELLDGETLDATVERGLLTLKDFEQVVNQTLEALIAAQSKNMLHRDLKPSNIMVNWLPSGKFQIKILDFGLAKISENPSVQTIDQGDAILGSIYFMAPEQFERRKLMAATDMYAMGCIYYNCLTGKYPFDGESAPQVMAAHLQHKVKPLRDLRPDLPDEVCQWVMWMINRDMTKRPQSAREALDRFPSLDGAAEQVYVAQVVPEPSRPKVLPAPPKGSGPQPRVPSGRVPSNRPSTAPQPTPPRKTSGRVPSGRVPTGRTGMSATSHQTSHVSAAAMLEELEARKKRTILMIVGGVVALAAIVIAAMTIAGQAQTKRDLARIQVLDVPKPSGTAEDVVMLTKYLSPDNKDPRAGRASSILNVLSGADVNTALVTELKRSAEPVARVKLLGIIRARQIPEAFDEVLRIFKSTLSKEERTAAAGALHAIAGRDKLPAMLTLLEDPTLTERADRKLLEETVIALVRMDPDVEHRIDPVLSRMTVTTGEVRKSLCRIMGAAGGRTALQRAELIYGGIDTEYQRDAMMALHNWPDRDCLPLINKVIDTTRDDVLKLAAVKAFIQILSLPSKVPDDSANWKKAFLITRPEEKVLLYNTVLNTRPVQSTLNYIAANPQKGFENYDKSVSESIKRTMAAAATLRSGETLAGTKANAAGRLGGVQVDQVAQCMNNWTAPETWLQWVFRLDAGNYEVEIESSYASSQPSHYELICAGEQISFQGSSTVDWDSFKWTKLTGKIEVTAAEGGVQLLVLKPGKVVGKRLMNLKSIRLTKVP